MNIAIPPEIILPRETDTNEPIGHEHFSQRTQFLRAMVLALNDGIVSISALQLSFLTGSKNVSNTLYILTGLSGIVAGSLSMFCSEYISVSAQKDSEKADILKEKLEQEKSPEARIEELEQLTNIYVNKGLDYEFAKTVAIRLTEHDVLAAHCFDEHGIDLNSPDGCGSGIANPFQAGIISFGAFLLGGSIPFLTSNWILSKSGKIIALVLSTVSSLSFFGGFGAYIGGSSIIKGIIRMTTLGTFALGVSFLIGLAFESSMK
jgi:VIT1/CCC1 family predicted Fe2+/Mn2+ transporter